MEAKWAIFWMAREHRRGLADSLSKRRKPVFWSVTGQKLIEAMQKKCVKAPLFEHYCLAVSPVFIGTAHKS